MRMMDKYATDSLFRETYRKVRAYSRSLCRNASDAEDITQETLVRAYVFLDSFDTRASFDTWVMKIAKNQYIDSLRRANRRVQMVSPETLGVSDFLEQCPDCSPNPEEEFVLGNMDPALYDAILQLSSTERNLLHMIAVENISIAEVARRLDSTPRRIKTRYRDIVNTVRLNLKLKKHREQSESLVYANTAATA